ncbi:MAG: TraB domain-containing protein [Treponema sp.]|nr:TraB domain-containing protein [Treponema sp.]
MNDTKMTLNLGDREFILIGTAHVSRESIDEVSGIIREEKPDLICVELDEGRYASITQKENWENLNMVKVFREGKGFLLIANLVLSSFQRRMGAELGVKPGEEMKTALDIAKELNIPHALCDREIQITLRRAWANCGIWNKSKLLSSLVSSAAWEPSWV